MRRETGERGGGEGEETGMLGETASAAQRAEETRAWWWWRWVDADGKTDAAVGRRAATRRSRPPAADCQFPAEPPSQTSTLYHIPGLLIHPSDLHPRHVCSTAPVEAVQLPPQHLCKYLRLLEKRRKVEEVWRRPRAEKVPLQQDQQVFLL